MDIGGCKAQFAIHGFHVKGEVTGRRAVELRVLGREEVQQVRMIVPAGPTPIPGQLHIKTKPDFVGRFKQMPRA